jgi:hypothetical protein
MLGIEFETVRGYKEGRSVCKEIAAVKRGTRKNEMIVRGIIFAL